MKQLRKWILNLLMALIIPILLLSLWEYAAGHDYIKATLMPPPSKIWKTLVALIQKGTLQKNIFVSLKRVLAGYLMGTLFGVVFGVAMGLFSAVRRLMTLLMDILRPIPLIAWVPVFILWLGIGEASKIVVIALGTFWPVFINVTDGIIYVDKKYIEVATVFCKNKADTIAHVILPAALPSIFTGLRLASGNALMGVVGAEMFAASSGLGYMVSNARELAQADKMLGGVLIIGILGWLLNLLVMHLGRTGKRQR